jgi:hypothetical protein
MQLDGERVQERERLLMVNILSLFMATIGSRKSDDVNDSPGSGA